MTVIVKDLAGINLTCPTEISIVLSVMKNKSKSNKMKIKQKEIFPDVIFLKAPKGVDLDIVGEIIDGDNWDMIFLEEGIACKVDRVDDVLEAYQEALDDLDEDEE